MHDAFTTKNLIIIPTCPAVKPDMFFYKESTIIDIYTIPYYNCDIPAVMR